MIPLGVLLAVLPFALGRPFHCAAAMFAQLAGFFGGTPAPEPARFDARERLKQIVERNEVDLLYLFAHGNLEREAFVQAAESLLALRRQRLTKARTVESTYVHEVLANDSQGL